MNIALNGENTLNCSIFDDTSDNIEKLCEGITVDGALTIGGGTLNATIEGNAIVANTLTIDNATLNSNSTSVNIYLAGDAIISNSKVFLKGGSPVIAIGFNKKLDIINSTVVIQSEGSYFGFSNKSTITIDENKTSVDYILTTSEEFVTVDIAGYNANETKKALVDNEYLVVEQYINGTKQKDYINYQYGENLTYTVKKSDGTAVDTSAAAVRIAPILDFNENRFFIKFYLHLS